MRTPAESARPDEIIFSSSIAAACCLASFLLLALHEPTATGSGSLATPCGCDASDSTSIRYIDVDWKERALEARRSGRVAIGREEMGAGNARLWQERGD